MPATYIQNVFLSGEWSERKALTSI